VEKFFLERSDCTLRHGEIDGYPQIEAARQWPRQAMGGGVSH